MEKLIKLQNILYILNKKPTYRISIKIDNEEKEVIGNNIDIFDEVIDFFLEKYTIPGYSISPINTLLEMCSKNKISTPQFTTQYIDNTYKTSCFVDNLETTSQHKKKKESKNQVSIEMIKLLADIKKITIS